MKKHLLAIAAIALGLGLIVGAADVAAQTQGSAKLTVDDAATYLREVLAKHADRYEAWGKPKVDLRIDADAIDHREGFRIEAAGGGGIEIGGGGYGGAIYGAQELGRLLDQHEKMPVDLKVADQPHCCPRRTGLGSWTGLRRPLGVK